MDPVFIDCLGELKEPSVERTKKTAIARHFSIQYLWRFIWCRRSRIKVEDKSNEMPAVPERLKLLYIKGAIVTLDAMGAQEDTVR